MFTGKLDLEVLKHESGMTQIIKDFQEIQSIENIILTTESVDIINHYHGILFDNVETYSVESALSGKENILNKIKSLKDRILKSFEESNGAIAGIYKSSFGGKVKTLKELREKIVSGEMVERTDVKNNDLNQYFGLFNMIGYNVSNVSDMIKAFTFHETAGIEILKENLDYGKEMYKNIFSADKIVKMVKENKLKPASKSLSFLNSIKDVEFKKVEFYTGFPSMIFTKNPGILVISVNDKEKLEIDTDVIKPKEITFNSFKKDDIIKLLDTAIKVLENSKEYTKKVADIVKPVLPTMITTYQGGGSTVETTEMRLNHASTELVSLVTKSQRFLDNLMVYAKHLGFTPYNVVKICEHIVKNNFEKAKK